MLEQSEDHEPLLPHCMQVDDISGTHKELPSGRVGLEGLGYSMYLGTSEAIWIDFKEHQRVI